MCTQGKCYRASCGASEQELCIDAELPSNIQLQKQQRLIRLCALQHEAILVRRLGTKTTKVFTKHKQNVAARYTHIHLRWHGIHKSFQHNEAQKALVCGV